MGLLILLLLFALSFSQHVKVLYSNGKVELMDGIKGKLELEDIKLKDMKVDGLTVEFKGRTFSGQARVLDSLIVGDGVVSFNRADPLRSSINGKLIGMGLNLQTFGNPSKSIGRSGAINYLTICAIFEYFLYTLSTYSLFSFALSPLL
jgi:hypothetical protein